MKNFIQPGVNVPFVAPYDVKSGDGMLEGVEFGVASTDAKNGEQIIGVTEGVFTLPKAAVAPTRKSIAYWDNAAKVVTNVATNNTKVGIFRAAGLSADPTIAVKLVPSI
jgi:predicted RecA/RadA family phage recombinase